ncbi:hypothetical protein WR25_16646 [Diploscapter pachys]|uniref:Uncharacterized protein n=1 Tax=Diploscapter pachys TaxID=2018661 RepID=A0A2A2K294_9BILA|nr:hypothetical protein WR25_16646 [Diploscapter pachys]
MAVTSITTDTAAPTPGESDADRLRRGRIVLRQQKPHRPRCPVACAPRLALAAVPAIAVVQLCGAAWRDDHRPRAGAVDDRQRRVDRLDPLAGGADRHVDRRRRGTGIGQHHAHDVGRNRLLHDRHLRADARSDAKGFPLCTVRQRTLTEQQPLAVARGIDRGAARRQRQAKAGVTAIAQREHDAGRRAHDGLATCFCARGATVTRIGTR